LSGGTLCVGPPGKGAAAEAVLERQGCVLPPLGLPTLPEVPRPAKVAKTQREAWGHPGKKVKPTHVRQRIILLFFFFAATFGCEQGVPLS